jgi:hypothetical protein
VEVLLQALKEVLRWPVSPMNWPPQYSWHIVESGVKYHNPSPNKHSSTLWLKTIIYIRWFYWTLFDFFGICKDTNL